MTTVEQTINGMAESVENAAAGPIWPPVPGEPPKRTSARGLSDGASRIFEFLEDHPGEWFQVGEYSSSQAPKRAWADRGVEVIHRKLREGVYGRYARYVGAEVANPLHRVD